MSILYESYAKSPTVKVTAQKRPSKFEPATLTDEAGRSVAGTTQYVGTKVVFGSKLYDPVAVEVLVGKLVRIMRQLNTGAWTKIGEVRTGGVGQVVFPYTLTAPRVNSFRCEWDGDVIYEGCDSKAVKSFVR